MTEVGELLSTTPPGVRALVCTGYFYPHLGGSERYSELLWTEMAGRGWSPVVLTCNSDGAPAVDRVGVLPVIRIPARDAFGSRIPLPLPGVVSVRLLTAIARWKPELVITNTRFFPTTALGALLARQVGVPRVHIEHGSEHVIFRSPLMTGLAKAIDLTLGAWSIRGADAIFGVSSESASFASTLSQRHAKGILPNAVSIGEAPSGRWSFPDDRPVVLYAGRLIPEKGLRTLREAMPAGATLAIAGYGPLEDELARDPAVKFLGRIDPREMPGLMRAADIFVHPSECAEGLPTVVLEAGAAGLPVIATPMGTATLLAESRGVLVPPGDVAALRSAIESLLDDPAARAALGSALKAYVRANHGWPAVADLADSSLREMLR